ncbi:enhanced ethylene response protein 5-like [Hevea brasiliensis]|uniref:enhanced ethylene response protein 5-like n=1 Tax=Hevea brasiliensis TaxID=3981 RepID=UPI0025F0F00F|nr:enhanced ethylene response protein 5-like [Hevea brasiliensis]
MNFIKTLLDPSDFVNQRMADLSMGEAHRRITDYLNRLFDAVFSQDGASRKTPPLFLLQFSFSASLADALIEFRSWESAWAMEALYVVAYEIRVLAERADKELASIGKSQEKLKGAGSFLMKVFGVLALGTVHLCRSVIRSIETARIFYFEEFPKGDKDLVIGPLIVKSDSKDQDDSKISDIVKLSIGILPKRLAPG